ncbi:ion channel [Streptomyces sp. NBC_01622]|uniref:ion channel n=1 Tax=Streptomyces sp. NBC_01622 TaxID=2975903 RepID=UPI0038658E40
MFSTVGFGDITAVTQTARVLTMAQMTGNILLVGVAPVWWPVRCRPVCTGRRRGTGSGEGRPVRGDRASAITTAGGRQATTRSAHRRRAKSAK